MWILKEISRIQYIFLIVKKSLEQTQTKKSLPTFWYLSHASGAQVEAHW